MQIHRQPASHFPTPLRQGMRSEDVRALQRQLDVVDDSVFGPATHRAVQSFQREHGLIADGIAGPRTWAALRASVAAPAAAPAGSWQSRLPRGLRPHAAHFEAAGKKYGVDPRFLAAISMQESGGGTSPAFRNRKNAMGIMGRRGLARFPSVGASITSMARDLGNPRGLYRGRDTIASIGARYCPVGAANDPHGLNAHWLPNVTSNYRKLGGDPAEKVVQRA